MFRCFFCSFLLCCPFLTSVHMMVSCSTNKEKLGWQRKKVKLFYISSLSVDLSSVHICVLFCLLDFCQIISFLYYTKDYADLSNLPCRHMSLISLFIPDTLPDSVSPGSSDDSFFLQLVFVSITQCHQMNSAIIPPTGWPGLKGN